MLGGVSMDVILPRNATEFYAQGDTITGHSKPKMTDALEKEILPQVQNLLPKIDSILLQINHILADRNIAATMQAMRTTSENLSATTAHLKDFTGQDLPRLTQSVHEVTGNLAAFTDKLNKLELEETLRRTNSTLAGVEQMTTKLGQKNNTLGLLLNDDSLYINLNRTAANAASLTQDLKANPKRYVHFSVFGKKANP
jgi:phospholipid/cholesterol/gamma-HCH transport system substrate-binding protein